MYIHLHVCRILTHLFRLEIAVTDKLLCQLVAVSVATAEDLIEGGEWVRGHHRRVGEMETLEGGREGGKKRAREEERGRRRGKESGEG